MKCKKLIVGLCLFLLTSCGEQILTTSNTANSTTNNTTNSVTSVVEPTTSTVTPSTSTSETIESTKPEPLTDWREDSIQNMEKAIGERLPFAIFSEYYVDESFEEEDGTFIFYIRDPAKCGQSVAYQDVLKANGFELLFNTANEDGQISTLGKTHSEETEIRVEIQNYLANVKGEELRLMAYLIRKTTTWPLKDIVSVVGYKVTIPSFDANEYYIYPNQEKHEIELYIPQTSDQCVTTYRSLLIDEGWNMVDGTDSSPYFANQQNYEIEFNYSNPYFQILIRYNGSNPPLIEGDVVITHQNFNDAGSGYQDLEFTNGNIHFMSSYMAKIKINGEYIVQMKKAESYLKNDVAVMQGIESIKIDVVNVKEEPYRGKVTVYAIDENETQTKIEEENGYYHLNGAKYFMIANESNFVFYFRSLSIQLVK